MQSQYHRFNQNYPLAGVVHLYFPRTSMNGNFASEAQDKNNLSPGTISQHFWPLPDILISHISHLISHILISYRNVENYPLSACF